MQIERNRLKKPIAMLSVIIGLLVLLFVWQYVRKEMAQQFSKSSMNQVAAVEVGAVLAEVWHPQVNVVGSIQAVQGTTISAEITGKITKILFDSGQMVTAGQPLVQLDDSSLRAQVQQAQAAYQLSQARFNRIQKVYLQNGVSKETYDESSSQVAQDQAALAKAQALLQQATISAPFAGKIGLRQVSLGQYVAAGDPMTNLQQIDPVYVDFDLPEDYINRVHVNDEVQLTTSAYANETFTGHVIATNAQLNVTTRTLNIRAEVPNTTQQLIPGMFVDVNVIVPQNVDVLTVPEMAVNYSPFGDSVFRVMGNKVEQVYVKIGEQRGNRVAITGNINAGERIVTTGVFKLQNGSLIKMAMPLRVSGEKHPGTVSVTKPLATAANTNTVQQTSSQKSDGSK